MTRTESDLFTLSKKMLLKLEDQFDNWYSFWTKEDVETYTECLAIHQDLGGHHEARMDIINHYDTPESLIF